MKPLAKYESNITSQDGEDGVIAEIFNRIGEGNKTCCEFGAWDGKHLSNTYTLWHDKNWSAFLIEGEKDRVENFKNEYSSFENVCIEERFVAVSGDNSLETILTEMGCKSEIDLLSIDIDSDDCAIFSEMKITPRLVVIEYNPTIPPQIELIQKSGNYMGASAKSIVEAGKKKGYSLVHLSKTNLFLLRDDLMSKVGFEAQELADIFDYSQLTYVITSYDGQPFLSRPLLFSRTLEPNDIGVRNYLKQKIRKPETPSVPEFESSEELIKCKITK